MQVHQTREATLLQTLREPHPHLIVRSAVSLSVGCLLAAAGLFAASAAAEFMFPGRGWWRSNHEIVGLSIASVAWLPALRLIWSPVRGRRQLVRPIFSTLAIWACALLLCGLMGDDFAAVLVLSALGFTLHCWTSAYVRWVRGTDLLGPDGQIDVRCPQCRYSLVGLTECRCPECGVAFTIDGLIAAQGYDGIHAETPRVRNADGSVGVVAGQLAPT